MYRKLPRKVVAPVAAAALFTLLLGAVPLLHAARAEFLGKDVSGLAASIVGIYPEFFVKELAAALCVSFLCMLPVSFFGYIARISYRTKGVSAWILFPGSLLLFYAMIYLQSLYRFPALYESVTPLWLEKIVFWSAGFLSPAFFQMCAVLLLGGLIGLTVYRVKKVRMPVVAIAVVSIICWIAVATAGGSKRRPAGHPHDSKPNILLISIDSLRSDYLESTMPTIQALRSDPETVDFRNHYVGVPRTFPSWVELLYGNYAPSTSVRHMFPGFGHRRQKSRPFPAVLKERGYETTIISDFAGDIFPRFETGFEQIFAPSMNLRGLIQLAVHQKFMLYMPFVSSWLFEGFFPALAQNPAYADPQRLARKFVSASTRSKSGRPWFTTIFFSTAHFPYAAPWPYYRSYTDPNYAGPFFFQKNPEITGDEVLTSENIGQTRGLYKGALAAIDQALASIFTHLHTTGDWEQTIVIITADHGEDLYENGRLQGHGEHLAGKNVIKVPFIMRVPQLDFSTRSPVNAVSRSIDVGRTLLGALGIDWEDIQGENLYPWISGVADTLPDLVAFSETGIWFSASGKGDFQKNRLSYPGISGLLSFDHGRSQEIVLSPEYERVVATSKHRSVVRGDRKLIYTPTELGAKFFLYDEISDPDNLNDLSASEPESLRDMKSLFFSTMLQLEPGSRRVGEYFVGP